MIIAKEVEMFPRLSCFAHADRARVVSADARDFLAMEYTNAAGKIGTYLLPCE